MAAASLASAPSPAEPLWVRSNVRVADLEDALSPEYQPR
jgi:hypothetical protein